MLQTINPNPRPHLVGNAALAAAGAEVRRKALLEYLARKVANQEPVPENEQLGALYGVSWGTIRDDFRMFRKFGHVETEHRKFAVKTQDDGMTVERRVRVKVGDGFSDWTPWPTDGKPRLPKSPGGLPPVFWSTRREKVSSAHTAPDEVEQAKDKVRRITGAIVCHLETIEQPNKAFEAKRLPPSEARVVVGKMVMSEKSLVRYAAGLQ